MRCGDDGVWQSETEMFNYCVCSGFTLLFSAGDLPCVKAEVQPGWRKNNS